MSAFRALRDVSNNFEYSLQQSSKELYAAKSGKDFEENVEKKLKDLALFSSKVKLLNASNTASTLQIPGHTVDNALKEYGDTAAWKVIEQVTAKTLTQRHAVKKLITSPDSSLDVERAERKQAIIQSLTQFRHSESQLRQLNQVLKDRESALASTRAEWDSMLGDMRELSDQRESNEGDTRGPLYQKLSGVVDRLELMRWLIGRLVCTRGPYDWLADPARRRDALPLTRQHHTIDMFTE